MNTADKFSKVFENALEVLDKIGDTGHNPFAGHRNTDDRTKSLFDNVSIENTADRQRQLGTLLDLVGDKPFTMQPGRNGAICIIFQCHINTTYKVGVVAYNRPIEGNLYKIEKVHGQLQARGEGEFMSRPAYEFTVVLTPEPVPDGTIQYALASIYPGKPDPDPNMPFDEGMTVHGIELIQAGITRVC